MENIEYKQDVTKDAEGQSRLNVRLAACLMWLIYKVFNPAILWCFGWKYEREICMGKRFECWVDPIDGKRYAQSIAIEKCEARIEGG